METKLAKPETKLTFYTQRNNAFNPLVTCFPTSVAMAIRNNGLELHPKSDVLMGVCIDDVFSMLCNTPSVGQEIAKVKKVDDPGKLNLYWEIEQEVARYFLNGFSWEDKHKATKAVKYFSAASLDSIKKEIDNGYCVIVRIPMRANKTNERRGGHIIVMCGYNDDGSGVFMDPYGDWKTWYSQTNGFLVNYSKDVVENWIGNKGSYLCMFVHSDLKPVE